MIPISTAKETLRWPFPFEYPAMTYPWENRRDVSGQIAVLSGRSTSSMSSSVMREVRNAWHHLGLPQ